MTKKEKIKLAHDFFIKKYDGSTPVILSINFHKDIDTPMEGISPIIRTKIDSGNDFYLILETTNTMHNFRNK